MAQLLLSWLNEDVKLSQQITNIEDDFRDGYLLGELLFHFNQQDNFLMFDRTFTPDSRIKNFCLLEPTIRRLGAPFNFALAFDIMKGKLGVTKALLAELRAILERIQKNSMPPIAPAGQRGQIMRVMRPGNERFDQSMSAAFEKSVRAMMDNPTDVILHKAVTSKFEAIGIASDNKAAAGDDQDTWLKNNENLRKREVFEHRKKHEAEFKKSWDLMNVDQWRKNQQTGNIRKLKEAAAISDYETRKSMHYKTIRDNARSETYGSIAAFDKRLEKEVFREDPSLAAGLGASLKKTVSGTDGSGLPTLEYTDQAFLDAGLSLALKSMKEHHTVELQRQVVHDRRRRKFIRQQENAHATALHTRAQSEIVEQLLNISKCEKIESEAQKRVLSQRAIITENRALRQEGIKAVELTTEKYTNAQSIEICQREKKWHISSQYNSLECRVSMLDESKASAARYRINEFASETVERLLDLVDWVVTSRHVGLFHEDVPIKTPKEDETPEEATTRTTAIEALKAAKAANPYQMDLLPTTLWADAKAMFTSSLPMAEATMKPIETNVYHEHPYSESEKPLCVDLTWLLSAPFQAHTQMAPVGTLERIVGELFISMEKEQNENSSLDSTSNKKMHLETSLSRKHLLLEGIEIVDDAIATPAAAPVVEGKSTLTPVPTITVLPYGSTIPTDRLVSEHLITSDAVAYIASVATADIEGGYDVVPTGAILPIENTTQEENSESFNKSLIVTPDWLYTTPSKHLLGEILIATSCAAVPIAQDFTITSTIGINIPPLPLRAALCGISEVSRLQVSEALKMKIPDLAIISSETLIHNAVKLAYDILLAESQCDSSCSAEVERAAATVATAMPIRTSEQELAIQILEKLQCGHSISDELYVALVINAIHKSLPPVAPTLSDKEIKERNEENSRKTDKLLAEEAAQALEAAAKQALQYPGFLLVDFPCTKAQSILLFKALSGINYNEDKPKAGDRASQFASALPNTYSRQTFDPTKCGLNKVIYMDTSSLLSLTDERVRSRTDLNTGEIVLMNDKITTINTVQELYTPLRPVHTASIEHSQTAAEKESLLCFLQDLQLVDTYCIGNWDGDYKTREDAVNAVVKDISILTNLYNVDGIETITSDITEIEIGSEETKAEAQAVPVPSVMTTPKQVLLDNNLAKFLIGLWTDAETQSMNSTRNYFSAMRDVRYQMIQRKRCLHDIISRNIVTRDTRQSVFEEFRDRYNTIDIDFRFDDTIIFELHLRTLELGRELWNMSDIKRDKILAILKGISKDGMSSILIHRCQCEGAAFMQAEFRRFCIAIHVILDFTKGSSSYDSSALLRNTLEECLAAIIPSKDDPAVETGGGKGNKKPAEKSKKGEVAAAVAWRNVVPPVLLPHTMMNTLPLPQEDEAPVDPKSKGKPPVKGKGEAVDMPANPLETMAANVINQLLTWTKENFTIQRVVYPNQESLCCAIESAIWHEAERCKFSIEQIKRAVQHQAAWINEEEENILRILERQIRSRHAKEYQVAHRLIHMISEVTEKAEPITNIWVIDGDAISVFNNQICVHPNITPPLPVVREFYENKLNSEQMSVLESWIYTNKTGSVILEQDVRYMMIQALNAGSGPAGMNNKTHVHRSEKRQCSKGKEYMSITIHKCENLFNADVASKSDPYVTVRLQNDIYVSKKVENDLNPVYDETYLFKEEWDGNSKVRVQVWDHDIHDSHDLIGSIDIDLIPYVDQLDQGETITLTEQPLHFHARLSGTINVSISVPESKASSLIDSVLTDITLPRQWQNIDIFNRLMEKLLPSSALAGLDENVGYVDIDILLNSLRDFDSSAEQGEAITQVCLKNDVNTAVADADADAVTEK